MKPGKSNRHQGDNAAELIPQQVAELAAELSETDDDSRRDRLARQLPELAARSGKASWRGLQSGSGAARRGLQSGGDVARRGLESGGSIAKRGFRAGGGAAWKGLQSGGVVAWKGLQAGAELAWHGVHAGSQRLSAEVLEMAPKIPIRNLTTLREQYPGRETEQLADTLIYGAARASSGVGAATGVAAAVPFIPTAVVELGVETLALVAIELKLIAELHEVYGMPAPGKGHERMMAYIGAWADRRGIRISGGGLALAMGSPLRRKLERRLIAKAGQSAMSLAPMLTGAAAGAALNHRETGRLGGAVRDDLRKRAAQAAITIT